MSFKVPTTRPPPPPDEPHGAEHRPEQMRKVAVANARALVRQTMKSAHAMQVAFEALGVSFTKAKDPMNRLAAALLELKEKADGFE